MDGVVLYDIGPTLSQIKRLNTICVPADLRSSVPEPNLQHLQILRLRCHRSLVLSHMENAKAARQEYSINEAGDNSAWAQHILQVEKGRLKEHSPDTTSTQFNPSYFN